MLSLRMAVVALVSTLASAQTTPGIINYVEGKVTVDGQPMAAANAGTVSIQPGQSLGTVQGRAEVLLTPGVFVRIGDNSVLKMAAVSTTAVKLELVHGEAVVEVDRADKALRLDLIDGVADARLEHSGVFLFKADKPVIDVYFGKTRVEDDGKGVELSRGQELLLKDGDRKPRKFDITASDPLFAWGLERADFAAQVSEWTAETLLGLDSRPTYPDGWYWSPWYKSWAYLPEKGYVLTPLGYGLYAPQTPHYRAPSFADFRN